ncbi:MAG: tRNA preQ1(34) S-adenosylmethionine ribosyltransferase-isomerase QueA [Syntrophaceae bacterium]|nr:tRNA preQ1(34) S-adenosylmethionine ribosyltransferase-isomerase QueA [Syntrophaceae bacterium]
MTSRHENNGEQFDSDLGIPYEFRLSTYSYELPEDLIAQQPLLIRDQSKLMVIYRQTGELTHHRFSDLVDLLRPDDVLVLNENKVSPGLNKGFKSTGGRVELLVLNPNMNPILDSENQQAVRECMVKSSKRLKTGSKIFVDNHTTLTVKRVVEPGRALIAFPCSNSQFPQFLERFGTTPLPPYIKTPEESDIQHKLTYQTVYSRFPGSIAAPTAGLHFTSELIEQLQLKGIGVVRITLHVGPGTFIPIRTADICSHAMEKEFFEISKEAAQEINESIADGRRIVAVGSTSVRSLESAAISNNLIRYGQQYTDLFIKPGFDFKIVKAMITNFHLPNSTLLALVSSFSSISTIKNAYAEAIKHRYRFFSYGDSSLIV